jgi:hypothetical protein
MVINITINIGKNRGGSKLYLYISVDYKSLFNIWLQRGGIYSYSANPTVKLWLSRKRYNDGKMPGLTIKNEHYH